MNSLSAKQNKILLYIILLTLSISLWFTISPVDQRNYLLIGCMGIGFILTVFSGMLVPKVDIPVVAILLSMIVPQFLFHENSIRWSSLLYSVMFGFYFMLGARVYAKSDITDKELQYLFKNILYAYCIVLIIQQLCRLTGLPVFNGIVLPQNEPWKLNSLAPEPSHSAYYIGTLMTAFCCISDLMIKRTQSFSESFKYNRKVWLAFFYTMITMMSGTAILMIFFVLARFISKRNLIIFVCLIVLFLVVGKTSGLAGLSRSSNFISAVLSGDFQQMIKADHSASVRVVPTMICFSNINPLSFHGWFGEGMGAVSKWMYRFFPGVPDDFSGGGVFKYIIEYGLLPGILLLYSSLRWTYVREIGLTSICLWIMTQVLMPMNMQIFWCYIMIFYIIKNKIELSKHKRSETTS